MCLVQPTSTSKTTVCTVLAVSALNLPKESVNGFFHFICSFHNAFLPACDVNDHERIIQADTTLDWSCKRKKIDAFHRNERCCHPENDSHKVGKSNSNCETQQILNILSVPFRRKP